MKPLLSGRLTDIAKLKNYPYLVSPKLDGIRALVTEKGIVSRTLKKIPNRHIQAMLGQAKYIGLDGELIVGNMEDPHCFNKTTSGVMSVNGYPEFKFHVFDRFNASGGFETRLESLMAFLREPYITIVPHAYAYDMKDILSLEEKYLNLGYEGIMIRHLKGEYKYGRSTEREEILLKLKRFEDDEAVVLDVIELMHNANEATVNELGQLERSHSKAGMVGSNTLGALHVKCSKWKDPFEIGTGFDDITRDMLWANKPIGKVIKFKYQPHGTLNKPRFPVFLGLRED